MKKLAAVTAITFLAVGAASAADMRAAPLPSRAPAPVAVVTYNWTGCYIGAGGGYGMYDQETQYLVDGFPTGVAVDNGGRGWFGTVQVGCDYQFGNFVIGAFGDYDFADISGVMSTGALGLVGQETLSSSWAAGGRLGYLPFQSQQLLVFVSGGYTQSRFDAVGFTTNFGVPVDAALSEHTYSGWFLGSGYEYQLGWFPGLTWKTEYRFADLSADVVPVTGTAVTLASLENRKYVQTIRSALVWRFNFGGPVVARY